MARTRPATLEGPPSPGRVIQAAPGPALVSDAARRRPVGRIGGIVGREDPGASEQLERALGPDSQTLSSAGPDLVVEWDACWIGEQLVRERAHWRRIVEADRLGEVEGAFALAWRQPDGTLLLARDAIGERTLFYAVVQGALVFASTLRALLGSGLIEPRLRLPALAAYLSYAYVPGYETLVEGLDELLPGEIVRYRRGHLARSRSWSLPGEFVSDREPDEDELRRRLRSDLERAVRRRLPAPGEAVGALLSGGVDSSLVVALARRLHEGAVTTFSVSFGAGCANELPFSTLVAEHCATEHRIVEITPQTVVAHLDEAIAFLNDPIGDPLTVPNALLFREAAREVGVVLNGEGGDPCFGGPKNLPMLLAEWLGDGGNREDDVHARERSYLRAHQKCYDDLPQMLLPAVREALGRDTLEARLSPHLADPRWTRFVTKLQALNLTFKGAHHILAKVDAESAPFGVLARAPLFDRGVVETAFAIPPQLKLKGSVEKYLLKQAVADLLPAAILERPKSGMLVPVEAWFAGPLLGEARARLLDGLSGYGLFERGYLERLLSGRLGGLRPRRGVKIWLLITLEAWLRTVFRAG